MKKPVPVGYEDFKEIIDGDFYYVDKTGLIKDILDFKEKVVLFTRPRRFGKTLNQSMLRYFFEKTDEDNSKLFDGLEISGYEGKYMQYQGKYPVITVSLKSVVGENFIIAYRKLRDLIINVFIDHSNILQSDKLQDIEKEKFIEIENSKLNVKDKDLFDEDIVNFSSSLAFLSKCLEKVYNQKVIVLIDEYDVPLEKAYFSGYYDKMIGIIRNIFESVLKTNNSLKMAVLTGCLRISKESIFTGLNNLKIYSVTNERFSSYFGFTVDEVIKMLKYYQQEDFYDTIKEWYDGYLFGKTEIYNPYSVSCAIDDANGSTEFIPQSYWANTSSNEIIRDLISRATADTRKDLEKLLNNKPIEKRIYFDLTYDDIKNINKDQIWSHLLFTGYLKQKYNPDTGKYKFDFKKCINLGIIFI